MVISGTVIIEYEWLYQYRLLDWPWDALYTWLAAFLLVDFTYYWIHRAYHGDFRLSKATSLIIYIS